MSEVGIKISVVSAWRHNPFSLGILESIRIHCLSSYLHYHNRLTWHLQRQLHCGVHLLHDGTSFMEAALKATDLTAAM